MRWLSRNSFPFINAPYKDNEEDRPIGDVGYGLGLILGTNDGWERLRDTGYLSPYGSIMNVYPKLKLGIFTVGSGPGMGPNHDMIHELVFDLVQGYVDANERLNKDYPLSTFHDYLLPNPGEALTAFAIGLTTKAPLKIIPTPENTMRINHTLLVGMYGLGVAGNNT